MQHSRAGSRGTANAFLQALGTMLTVSVLSPLTDERDSTLLHVAKSQLQDCVQLGDLASRGSMREPGRKWQKRPWSSSHHLSGQKDRSVVFTQRAITSF